MIFFGSNCQQAIGQPFTVMDVNCRWSLNRRGYLTCCFTASRERLLLQLLYVQSQRNRLSSSVWTASAVYSDGGVIIIAEWSDCVDAQHGADGIWLLAVLSPLITYVYRSNVLLSPTHVTYHWESFYNHFSLWTEVVQKLYRNGPPSCIKVVQADSACSSCTEIGLYWSRPPPSRSGHVSNWS